MYLAFFLRGATAAPNDSWAAGDLAICINDRWGQRCGHAPAVDDMLRVSAVHVPAGTFLQFEGKPTSHLWSSAGFRKVRPDHTRASAGFSELLEQVRPKVDA